MRVNRIVFADPQNLQRGEIVIPTILLARELALPSLLPAAFWFASTHLECLAHPRAHALSDSDRHLILSAAKPLRAAHAEYLFNWLDEDAVPSPECTTPDVCCAQKLKSALGLWKPPGLSLLLRWRPGAAHGLCPSCVAVGKKHHEEGTRRLWRELPAFFGLPAWDEMEVGSKKDEGLFICRSVNFLCWLMIKLNRYRNGSMIQPPLVHVLLLGSLKYVLNVVCDRCEPNPYVVQL
jgi:hypothetical protein